MDWRMPGSSLERTRLIRAALGRGACWMGWRQPWYALLGGFECVWIHSSGEILGRGFPLWLVVGSSTPWIPMLSGCKSSVSSSRAW